MNLDFKNIKVGDRVVIWSYGSKYPGTVLKRNLSGKTIVVGENDFTVKGMGIGRGSMIKELPLKNVKEKNFLREITFRWSSRREIYFKFGEGAQYVPILGRDKGWKDLYIDYGR